MILTINSLLNNTSLTVYIYNLLIVHLFFKYSRFGPMVRSWCMRYEVKHSYFKSLAERHQTRSCYLMSSQCGGNASPLAKNTKIGKLMKLQYFTGIMAVHTLTHNVHTQ